MAEVQQPQWIDVTSFETAHLTVQLDVNARPGDMWQYRHRSAKRLFTGDDLPEWRPGQPDIGSR